MPEDLRQALRTPLLTMAALLALLGVNVLLGIFFINGRAWMAEVCVAAGMIAIVLLVAMEALHEPPLTRLLAGAGFFWVAILFGLTMMDYLTR